MAYLSSVEPNMKLVVRKSCEVSFFLIGLLPMLLVIAAFFTHR